MKPILVIDDDRELCELLGEYLGAEGFDIEVRHDGAEGAEAATEGHYELIILDVMLPGMNGFDVLREIRKGSDVPVIMLTARGEEIDRVLGLEMGADDYLPKPFSPRELLARIRAILRRSELPSGREDQDILVLGDVEMHVASRQLLLGGEAVELTTMEFRLIEEFLRSAGTLLTRESLMRSVLERSYSPFDRSLDMHVSNLRKKLGNHPDGTERIRTLRGEGYLYALPLEEVRRQ